MKSTPRKATRLTHLKKGNVSACYKRGKEKPPAKSELTAYADEVTCAKCLAIMDDQIDPDVE